LWFGWVKILIDGVMQGISVLFSFRAQMGGEMKELSEMLVAGPVHLSLSNATRGLDGVMVRTEFRKCTFTRVHGLMKDDVFSIRIHFSSELISGDRLSISD